MSDEEQPKAPDDKDGQQPEQPKPRPLRYFGLPLDMSLKSANALVIGCCIFFVLLIVAVTIFK